MTLADRTNASVPGETLAPASGRREFCGLLRCLVGGLGWLVYEHEIVMRGAEKEGKIVT